MMRIKVDGIALDYASTECEKSSPLDLPPDFSTYGGSFDLKLVGPLDAVMPSRKIALSAGPELMEALRSIPPGSYLTLRIGDREATWIMRRRDWKRQKVWLAEVNQ